MSFFFFFFLFYQGSKYPTKCGIGKPISREILKVRETDR